MATCEHDLAIASFHEFCKELRKEATRFKTVNLTFSDIIALLSAFMRKR